MKKIPTVFRRDPDDMRHVLPDVHPDCQWVLDGEGTPTRKYDGTCVMFDGARWWARREVKPGKTAPGGFEAVEHDEVTGKTVGWEPVEQSAFAKLHAEALAAVPGVPVLDRDTTKPEPGGTYELVGPKVNRNPEAVSRHTLVAHGYMSWEDQEIADEVPREYGALRTWLLDHPAWEGIVWHHPDGRMAKLKRRDFATPRTETT